MKKNTLVSLPSKMNQEQVKYFLIALIFFSLSCISVFSQQNYNQVTTAELDSVIKKFQSDLFYVLKMVRKERQKTIEIFLAGVQRKPENINDWESLMMMRFSQDKIDAHKLPATEKKIFYQESLRYLQNFQLLLTLNKKLQDSAVVSGLWDVVKYDIAFAAVESGETDIAIKLAEERLKNNTDPHSDNYGDHIYNANSILGRAYLRRNDLQSAKKYFVESGNTPGSIIINQLGPDFILARELLEKGEKTIVLAHLEKIRKLWKSSSEIDAWKKVIEEGKIPDSNKWY